MMVFMNYVIMNDLFSSIALLSSLVRLKDVSTGERSAATARKLAEFPRYNGEFISARARFSFLLDYLVGFILLPNIPPSPPPS